MSEHFKPCEGCQHADLFAEISLTMSGLLAFCEVTKEGINTSADKLFKIYDAQPSGQPAAVVGDIDQKHAFAKHQTREANAFFDHITETAENLEVELGDVSCDDVLTGCPKLLVAKSAYDEINLTLQEYVRKRQA